jgi:hypothetical protein
MPASLALVEKTPGQRDGSGVLPELLKSQWQAMFYA